MNKNFVIMAFCLALAFIAISGCVSQGQGNAAEKVNVSFKATGPDGVILEKTVQVEKGTNAFAAMQQATAVEFTDYGEMGILIESINGVTLPETHYWKLVVDGQDSAVGISSITIDKDTNIEWYPEAIQGFES